MVTFGLLGGGQLGRMLAQESRRWGLPHKFIALDPTPGCPARPFIDRQIVGSFKDPAKVRELASVSDILTPEIEHISVDTLEELARQGKVIHPSPQIVRTIQDKFTQKEFLRANGISVPDFQQVNSKYELLEALGSFGYPAVLKARKDSYDGRGNFVLKSPEDVDRALTHFNGRALYIEKHVNFSKEVSVIVSRDTAGNTKTYPVGENEHIEGILHRTIVPARVDSETATRAQQLAVKTMDAFRGVGTFGIEMFVDGSDILVNEVAPRVHNSGHYTINACRTSQFINHLLAISGQPLGDTTLLYAAVMVNILGDADSGDKAYRLEGDKVAEVIPGVHVFDYGKATATHKRKLGHVTVTGVNAPGYIDTLIQRSEELRKFPSKDHPEKGHIYQILNLRKTEDKKMTKHVEIRTGSDSDLPGIEDAFKFLRDVRVPYDARILSAHRTPDAMREHAIGLEKEGKRVSIGAAGGSAHLQGMTAAYSLVPVVAIPVKTSYLSGVESFYSNIQMPDGIPLGCVGIGQARAAGILAAQIASLDNLELRQRIREARGLEGKVEALNVENPQISIVLAGSTILPHPTNKEPQKKYDDGMKLLEQFGMEVTRHGDIVNVGDGLVKDIESRGTAAIIALCNEYSFYVPSHLAARTDIPVIAVPFLAEPLREHEPEKNMLCKMLVSLLEEGKPVGSPVAGMGINRVPNAAIYAGLIAGIYNPAVRERVRAYRTNLAKEVSEKNEKLGALGAEDYIKGMKK